LILLVLKPRDSKPVILLRAVIKIYIPILVELAVHKSREYPNLSQRKVELINQGEIHLLDKRERLRRIQDPDNPCSFDNKKPSIWEKREIHRL
jgi:hypothetical protein